MNHHQANVRTERGGRPVTSELPVFTPAILFGIHFGGSWKWPATTPGTVMSSSSSSQRKAYPLTST